VSQPLWIELEQYLALQRALGFKLEGEGRLLSQFVAYLEDHEAPSITVEGVIGWARLPAQASPRWHAKRLSMARRFAAYLNARDPSVQIPPPGLIRSGRSRATPYLYTDVEITAVVQAATMLRTPLLTATYQTLIRLLWVTGLRIGEAVRLDDGDVDARRELLTVRQSKFGKSRLVPLHPATTAALAGYQRRRDQLRPHANTTALFVNISGARLGVRSVHYTWPLLVQRAGLQPRSASCRPRVHDLRHSFAVRTLLRWYRQDADVRALLPRLSTYLGHTDPKHTYWYLSAAPELLGLAAARLTAHMEGTL
jgi:integrase/recombinase XerD